MTPPPAQSQLKPLSECREWLNDIVMFTLNECNEQNARSTLAHIDALEKREAAARETLRFYADQEKWKHRHYFRTDVDMQSIVLPLAHEDHGQKARDTLRIMEGK